jgi:hypothetical protein
LLARRRKQRTKQLIAFDRLKAEKTIENYIGRFWSQDDGGSGRDFLRAIMGRRPFEGPKSFLRPATLSWFVDGLKRADLVPATYNYVESQLAKIAEMERVISAEHMLRQEEKLGRAQTVMLGAGVAVRRARRSVGEDRPDRRRPRVRHLPAARRAALGSRRHDGLRQAAKADRRSTSSTSVHQRSAGRGWATPRATSSSQRSSAVPKAS